MLLLLFPLEDSRPENARVVYDHARKLFEQGRLADCQEEAEQGHKQFQVSSPDWAAKLKLLGVEAMVWRGMYDDAQRRIALFSPSNNPEWAIRKLTLEAMILVHQDQLPLASRYLAEALDICRVMNYQECGDTLQAGGILAVRQGNLPVARQYLLESLAFAQAHQERFLAANVSMNLGWAALQVDHFDEAADWSRTAYQAAAEFGAEDLAQTALGNLGWAYYQLGDGERALEQFSAAEKCAERLGDVRGELNWTSTAGYVYRDTGDLARATESYRHALALAKRIDSKEDIVNALEDLAQVSVDSGNLDQAGAYIAQVAPMELAGGNRLSANVLLTQGMLAAARGQNQQAESLFRTVRDDAKNPTTTRLGAGEQLARLEEREGKIQAAERMYKATLNDFDSAQAELKSEETRLPFVANATRIYDGYIHLLVAQGKSDQALAVADRSRARTLAQALGVAGPRAGAASLNPRRVAQKAGATLLFYWLGPRQSYLWAITPAKATLLMLPAQAEIVARIDRYRKALLDFEDPLRTGNQDGQALYGMLVSPAAKLIRPGSPVMILVDGELSKLNFETLLAPGPSPEADQGSGAVPQLHYWIDDATLLAAPSLSMLGATMPAPRSERRLLLLGNPVSPSPEFPSLPLFGFEMKSIQEQFAPSNVAVFARQQATPAAYLASNPAQFSYIHFVSHAVASSTDPLDSAIILSASSAGENSFKLYARDIMQHPIGARLVTISACYGSGTRSYAGEGLVGLSWAFLRAGSRSVIGALWEASDDSSPRLMNTLYQGLKDGESPAAALRLGKLALLHRQSRFRAPFYWAPFQIYTR